MTPTGNTCIESQLAVIKAREKHKQMFTLLGWGDGGDSDAQMTKFTAAIQKLLIL